jgi:peptidoglycan/LPS O-acetylase OafA/YrhL
MSTVSPATQQSLSAERSGAYPYAAEKRYIPALDGMRAFSIAVVVASHFWVSGPIPGGFGVTVFFFISGFLITRLLLAEQASDGHISIGRFYVRRFLRLYPALFVLVVVLGALYTVMRGTLDAAEIMAALFYYMNYYVLIHPDIDLPIRMLWSLAIEEHYYFVYPLLFAFMAGNPRRFAILLAVVAVLVLVWRLVLVHAIGIDLTPPTPGLPYTYIATDARLDSILYGAILALLAQSKSGLTLVRRLVNWPVFLSAAAILLVAFVPRDPAFQETWRYAIQGICLIPLVAGCVHGRQFRLFRGILETPVLVWVGKVSYSIYLWHFGIVRLVRFEFPKLSVLEQAAIGLPPIFIAAALSYYLVERPVLALRARWR